MQNIYILLQVILLAAGVSKRFSKGNKLLYTTAGQSLLAHTLENIHAASLGKVMLITGFQRAEVLAQVADNVDFREVYNPDYKRGMTSSIQCAIQECSDKVSGYMICLSDQIKIQPSTYKLLAKTFTTEFSKNQQLIVSPYYNAQKGNPVILSAHYRDEILALNEVNGCRPILLSNPQHIIKVSTNDSGILQDIDRVEDLPED